MFNEFKQMVDGCGNDVTLYHGTNNDATLSSGL